MQRRIKAQPQETAAYQALIDHKQATLNVILAQIPNISTFAQLGELIGYSHEWVRQRLVQSPEKLYKNIRVQISCLTTFPTLKALGIAQTLSMGVHRRFGSGRSKCFPRAYHAAVRVTESYFSWNQCSFF